MEALTMVTCKKKLSVGLALTTILMAAPVMATNYTGPVQTLRFSTGVTPARVSISVGPTVTTACNTPWYSFENADSGLGKLWVATLLAAKAQGRTVFVSGTGTCDNWSIERVNFIDIQ